MTKDEIIAQKANIETLLKQYQESDYANRKELSKILGSFDTHTSMGSFKNPDVVVLSWFGISSEIGKLLACLACKEQVVLNGRIENVEKRLRWLETIKESEKTTNLKDIVGMAG